VEGVFADSNSIYDRLIFYVRYELLGISVTSVFTSPEGSYEVTFTHSDCNIVCRCLLAILLCCILQLIISKCIPVLLYGLEACPLVKSEFSSLDFVINRFLMKMFNKCILLGIARCILILICQVLCGPNV